MTVLYESYDGSYAFTFRTDRTKPHPKGKYIAGFANTIDDIKQSVMTYLGNDNFTLIEVTA